VIIFFELLKWPTLFKAENVDTRYSRVQFLWFGIGIILNESWASYTVSIKNTILSSLDLRQEDYERIRQHKIEEYYKEIERLKKEQGSNT
jgi:hypothetical protein